MFKKILALLLGTALSLSLVACGNIEMGSSDSSEAPPSITPQGQVVVGQVTSLTGSSFFTTAWGNTGADNDLRKLIYGGGTIAYGKDGVYAVDPTIVKTMNYTDGADGSRTYQFTLNDNLRYNDGSPLLAKDYVFSILLTSSPEFGSVDGAATTTGIDFVGYESFNSGETKKFSGVRLLNDKEFSVTVKSEKLPYFYELTMVNIIPYPMAVIAPGATITDDGSGAVWDGVTADKLAETIGNSETGYRFAPKVTAGAYTFESFDRGSKQAVLKANPNYPGNFQGQKPMIETIIMKTVTSANQKDELSAGSVDLLTGISGGTEIEAGLDLVDNNQANYLSYERAGYGKLAFSCDFGPTQFVAVRQAIAHLLDVQEFARQFTGGYGIVVGGMYGAGQWMYQDKKDQIRAELTTYDYDVEKAKQLLIEDGWTKNANGSAYQDGIRYKEVNGKLMPLSINWASTATPVSDLLNTVLPSAMAQVGMKLNVTQVDFSVAMNHVNRQGIGEPEYHMFNLATGFNPVFDPWYYYNPDPAYMGVYNSNFIVDDELFQLAAQMRETSPQDKTGYADKWLAFQKRWNEVLPDLPLYSDVYHDFYNPRLEGYKDINAFWTWSNQILYCNVK